MPLAFVVHAADKPDSRYFDYLHGLLAERAGRSAEALSDYQKVIALDPHAVEVYRDMAELQLRLGHANEAVSAAEHLKTLAPKEPDTLMFLGNVYVAQGNLAKAAEAYEQVLKIDPNNLRALENLGNYYSILDPEKGMTYYQRYLALDPNDSEIYFQMALTDQKQGKNAKALELFQKSAALGPDELAPHLALASVYESASSTAAAIGEFEKAISIQPQNASLYVHLGRLYYADHRWDEAGSALQNARALAPDDATIPYWLARVDEEREDWKDAARQAEAAYQQSKDPQFLPLVAYYLTLDHRPAEAIPWLEKARSATPTNTNALLFLGMNYLDVQQPEKARRVLAEGLALQPKDTQLMFQLANAEDRLGHVDTAIVQFQAILALDPKNSGAMNYIGYSWAERGVHLAEAEKLLRQATVLDASNGAYLDSLGWVRFKQGERREAIQLLDKAAHLMPDSEIYGHLGDVYAADGDLSAAWQTWTKALALDPKNAVVRKKINEAERHVLQGTDARKLLKYVAGNNRQIESLKAATLVTARWRGHTFKTPAQLHYHRPDSLVLDLSLSSATLRIVVSSGQARIEPPELTRTLGDLPLDDLEALPAFLSGRLLDPLDNPSVKTKVRKRSIYYSDGVREAWIDAARGTLTRFIEERPATGRYEVEILSYAFVEGLWLPTEMRVRSRRPSWKATLTFSDWQINKE